jgi:hypothetical protein
MGNEQVEKLVDCAVRGAAIGGGELGALLCVDDVANARVPCSSTVGRSSHELKRVAVLSMLQALSLSGAARVSRQLSESVDPLVQACPLSTRIGCNVARIGVILH